jgi:hypothetical protein
MVMVISLDEVVVGFDRPQDDSRRCIGREAGIALRSNSCAMQHDGL